MPSTKAQMRAAGLELRRRREGEVTQEANRASSTRPMGAMSTENLRRYAQSIDKEIAKLDANFKADSTDENAARLMRARRQKAREYGS